MNTETDLRYLQDRWDDTVARDLDEVERLRYRSNLLGADLRITNFGGGNTSAKVTLPDPLDGTPQEVLWIKGSGGDLGSMKRQGLASLYLKKLHALRTRYRGAAAEDEMVELYPLCTFANNPVATSIDTPLHGFLPFTHVDHLHPDWGIALAAAANGREVMDELNARFGHHFIWLPWRRPGFELAMLMRNAVESAPGCDGIVLAGHGIFTWGDTARECYQRSLAAIDHLGQVVLSKVEQKGRALFGGPRAEAAADRRSLAVDVLPFVRGRVSAKNRQIAHHADAPEVLRFVGSRDAEALARLGTSCPDHFIRTKIRPLYVNWDPSQPVAELRPRFEAALASYREEYRAYYQANAQPSSPALRDDNPSVVLIPGVGMLTFGKTKSEARIVSEFYTNAIHVMEGATALGNGKPPRELPQAGLSAPAEAFAVHDNYVALPLSEAFGIEYWQLEEAKLRRQPPEKELSRFVVVVVGGGSGIGRSTAVEAARRGAHLVVADLDLEQAKATAEEARQHAGKEGVLALAIDIRDRASIKQALRDVVAAYGGIDVLINTAAVFPSSPSGQIDDATWASTFDINVTANHRLADEAAAILREQGLEASVVLTSSANAVVAKRGSEAYDVSKAALSHLVRELATSLAPNIRVNAVSPATVVSGSAMFGRDRVRASLEKYSIAFDPNASDAELGALLAEFYSRRSLTRKSIQPHDCARALLFLAGPLARCTTGHVFPVDGGLADAFLR
ncbi:MAG TPA: bifunctional rhamnulose-1-phosphate aldolase/short-chain dehydrogenase [Polyangiaceae bacterium]|nr:bifunctional rhamnulose-1-phosphate aldolase/short-chain dehydrogenase [Polyangiaceae bacterium]